MSLRVSATPVYQYPQDVYAAKPVSRADLRARREREQQVLSADEREWATANADALKKNPSILEGIRKFWTLALGETACGGGEAEAQLTFAQYLQLHVRLTKLLSPSFSQEMSLGKLAQRDWVADLERMGAADTSEETGLMDWAAFVESLFELCDLWTATAVSENDAAAAYAAFLGSCFERITTRARSHAEKSKLPHDGSATEHAASEPGIKSEHSAAGATEQGAAGTDSDARSLPILAAPVDAVVDWCNMDDVLSCVGNGASPLSGVSLLPPPDPKQTPNAAKQSKPALELAAVAALKEDNEEARDTSAPPGAWGQLEVPATGSEAQVKPTPPKQRSAERRGNHTGRKILQDDGLTKQQRKKIEGARMLKQQTVDVESADGSTTTFDLRQMRATKYTDRNSMRAAARGEDVEAEERDVQLESIEIPAWVTKPEAWKQQMDVRAKLAKELSDERETRFKQFTDRFVDLRARYINQLTAEITGRALAKRTFDTSWMGELRKPSSLDPTGWVALRPVSGAAATVFFLRQVLGLAAAWEAEPLALMSTVEQGALLLHAVCRTTLSGRMLATELANCVQGPEYPELQCPVGTEQIAGLVLAATQRIPGIEVAMATGVDEAISRFPAVLDMLGNEQVSRMDGCNLVDTLVQEVFSQVRERTGYGDGTVDNTGTGGKSLVLDPASGDGGIKIVSSLTLSLPSVGREVSITSSNTVQGDVLPAAPPSPRLGSVKPKSQSARASGISVPAHMAAPRFRGRLTTLGGISPRWYPTDMQPSRPTDEFLSPLRHAGAARAAHVRGSQRRIGNASDVYPTSRLRDVPKYTTSAVGPRILSETIEQENDRLQRMIEQGDDGGYPALPNVGSSVAPEESKPFSELSEPSKDTSISAWVAATARGGQRRALEEARALVDKGPSTWSTPHVQPPHSRAWLTEVKAAENCGPQVGIQPTGQKWHVQTRSQAVEVAYSGVQF